MPLASQPGHPLFAPRTYWLQRSSNSICSNVFTGSQQSKNIWRAELRGEPAPGSLFATAQLVHFVSSDAQRPIPGDSSMLGARPQRPPPPPAATADAATATTPLLDRIFNGRGREPVLPVRTQKVRFTCSKAISNGGSWHPSKSSVKPTSKQRLRCAAAWAVLVLLVAATVGAVAIYTYVQSILHEDPAAVAEAAAEARAAARAAATQQPEVLAYTVVVMSYVKRLGTVRTVVNKLGSCPSGECRELDLLHAAGLPASRADRHPAPTSHNTAAAATLPSTSQSLRCCWCGMGPTPPPPPSLTRLHLCASGRSPRQAAHAPAPATVPPRLRACSAAGPHTLPLS